MDGCSRGTIEYHEEHLSSWNKKRIFPAGSQAIFHEFHTNDHCNDSLESCDSHIFKDIFVSWEKGELGRNLHGFL